MTYALLCPCCGSIASEPDPETGYTDMDGKLLDCGCPGWVVVDGPLGEEEAWVCPDEMRPCGACESEGLDWV